MCFTVVVRRICLTCLCYDVGMSKLNRGVPQPSVSLRLPQAALEYLDLLAAQRSVKTSSLQRRADVIEWLLSRVTPPPKPVTELEADLARTYRRAFGEPT